MPNLDLSRTERGASSDPNCIFLLTFFAKNLIYESHCDFQIAKFDVRENQSMKNAAKKAAAKKKAAPKKKK